MSSRRTARDWARPAVPAEPVIDVLLPTSGRIAELDRTVDAAKAVFAEEAAG
jgi:hypothetical protein